MTDKQPEAMQVAEYLENDIPPFSECALKQAAALLRTQHAAIERKDALLRRALDALGSAGVAMRIGHMRLHAIDDAGAAIEAITKELEQ